VRAGAQALSLLAVPLNVHVLTALEDEPRSLVDLRRAVGSPPQTTMRVHLRNLTELSILHRRRQSQFPGPVDYELGTAGQELLHVARVLRVWLVDSPDSSLSVGSAAAKSAVKALVDGWSSTMVRAIAARPLSLTELNRLIPGISYPSLERRLAALRLAGLIEACPSRNRATPYAATEWLRRAIAPLALAARWERKHVPSEASPIGRLDIEAAFLLAVPMLRLSPELTGVARLAVETQSGEEHRIAGVLVEVKEGEIVSCVARLQGQADAWASGSAAAWLRAVIDRQPDHLEVGGDCELANELVDSLNGTLFGVAQRR